MQPSVPDLFGTGATLDANNNLTIPYAALQAAGLTTAPPTALEAYACVVKTAHAWLGANTDETVQAISEVRVSSPAVRNGVERTEFIFTESFFADYAAPTFNPTQV